MFLAQAYGSGEENEEEVSEAEREFEAAMADQPRRTLKRTE